jgi:arylsulfatase
MTCLLIGSATGASNPARPNIMLILADDMGFSDAGCYGGEIQTPNLDRMAAHGLRFTQHYSTGRCWPSRACLLTGYYAQQVRRDKMPGIAMGRRPAWAPLLPVALAPQGYRSYHSGKWHIDGDPLANGFARSWGGHKTGCDWDRFFSSGIWEEDGIKAPVEPGEPYYSTVAIADHAIQCLKLHRQQHPNAPFFQYVAFYSPHFPLHALQEDIALYRDTYTQGWDAIRKQRWQRMTEMGIVKTPLSARDEEITPTWNLKPEALQSRIGPGEAAYAVAWDTLRDEQKAFQAAKMAIHAAMVTRMDMAVGRILAQLRDMGAYDNTLILFASDNGASAEQIIRGDGHDTAAAPGSARSYLCLGPGWATAANAPFRLHKHWNHEGGISSPCIVHWPRGFAAQGELRHVPSHFIDIAPTFLDVAGGAWPETVQGNEGPAHPGTSLVPAFARDHAIRHEALWWCHAGNQALRMGDWKLTMRKGKGDWELYNLSTDRCEMTDLASTHPARAAALARQWESMAQGFRQALD